MLEITERAIRLDMIPERRATSGNGIGDDLANGLRQRHQFLFRLARRRDDGARCPKRRQMRPPQGLADIDIA